MKHNVLNQMASILNSVDMESEISRAESIYNGNYVGTEEFTIGAADDSWTRESALTEIQRYLATVSGYDINNEYIGQGKWGMSEEYEYASEAREDEIEQTLNQFKAEAQKIMQAGAKFVVLVNYKGEEAGMGYAPACKHLQKFISKHNYL